MTTPERDLLPEQAAAWFAAQYTPSTRRRYNAALRRWLLWCRAAGVHPYEATRLHALAWLRQLRHEGLAESTIRAHQSTVLLWYRHMVGEGVVDRSPFAGIARPVNPSASTATWLVPEEVQALLASAAQASPVADALVHVLALNGLRHVEALELRVSDLGTHAGVPTAMVRRRKTSNMQVVSLSPPTARAIKRAVGTLRSGHIMRGPKGRRIKDDVGRDLVAQVAREAGIERRVTPRILRVTFITLSLEAGVPPRDVMASAGHANLSMTSYYDRLRGSVDRNATHRLTDWLTGEP